MSDLRYWRKLDDIPVGVPFEDMDEETYIFIEDENGTKALRYYDKEIGQTEHPDDVEWAAPECGYAQEWSPFLELPPPPKTDVELIVDYIRSRVVDHTELARWPRRALETLAESIERGDWKPDGYSDRGR